MNVNFSAIDDLTITLDDLLNIITTKTNVMVFDSQDDTSKIVYNNYAYEIQNTSTYKKYKNRLVFPAKVSDNTLYITLA